MRILLFILALSPLLADTELQVAVPKSNISTNTTVALPPAMTHDSVEIPVLPGIERRAKEKQVVQQVSAPRHPEAATRNWIEPPFAKVGTEVSIYVGERLSIVEENATYDYVQFLDQEMKDHIFFHYPLFIAKDIDLVETTAIETDIVLKVEGREFAPIYQEEIEIPDNFQAAPENLKLVMLTFSIPRPFLRERTKITFTYTQEHYLYHDRPVIAYYPYLPYYERLKRQMKLVITDYTVTFRVLAKDKFALHRLTGNTPVESDTPSQIKVRPVHQENIAVEVRPLQKSENDKAAQ